MSGVSDRTDEEGRRELCDRVQHRAKVPCRNHTAQKGAEPSHYGAKCVRQVAKLRNHAAIAPEQAKTRGQGCHIVTHCEQAVSVTGDPSPPAGSTGLPPPWTAGEGSTSSSASRARRQRPPPLRPLSVSGAPSGAVRAVKLCKRVRERRRGALHPSKPDR